MKAIRLVYTDKIALVDDEDYDKVSELSWSFSHGYATHAGMLMHAFVMGDAPPGTEIHHKDGNRLNNQKSNLEFVTYSAHAKLHKGRGQYGYYGVFKTGNKFGAQISKDRIRYYMGSYETPEEAAGAYDRKARELFGPDAQTNFYIKFESP